MADFVRFGDQVALYSQDHCGYMFSHFSSSAADQLYVYHNQDRLKPKGIQTQHAIAFEVCAKNRYKLRQKYEKLLLESKEVVNDSTVENNLQDAKINAEIEARDNEAEQKRLRGRVLRYGQEIQLLHKFSNKFIHTSMGQTSTWVKNNLMIFLSEKNAKSAQFKIRPKYKVKSEGDTVRAGDQIVFESIKSPGQFIDLSPAFTITSSIIGHEVNLGVHRQGFTVVHVRHWSVDDNLVKSGSVLRFYHKEIGAYLTAEGVFPTTVSNNVHLRIRRVDQARPHTNYPSTSGNVYWQIEAEDGPLHGDTVTWQQQVRIRHMTTRQYLCVLPDGAMTLEDNAYDPNTVFCLHPVIDESDEVTFDSYCRVEHVLTGFWLHGQEDKEFVRSDQGRDADGSQQGETVQWDGAKLCQVRAEAVQKYDDAFTLQMVESEDVQNFNMVAGLVPLIQALQDPTDDPEITSRRLQTLHKALQELMNFLIIDGTPVKRRQKLMRNLRVADLCVEFLQKPVPDHLKGSPVYGAVQHSMYDVLVCYLTGDSRKNDFYFAKYIRFFQTQYALRGSIGLKAVTMITELTRDHWQIIKNVTPQDINRIISLVKQFKDYQYLDLLGVLCVCDNIAIPENQNYITKKWLCEEKDGVFFTEIGAAIGKSNSWVYVSMKDKPSQGLLSWVPLEMFVKDTDSESGTEFDKVTFLECQLDLFGNLCYGRNSFAINVIAKTLKYLTWNEAFTCLKNDRLPSNLRAKYCKLIINLFVDVEGHYPILEYPNLSFDYLQLGSNHSFINDRIHRVDDEELLRFQQLHDWLTGFLDRNQCMIASDISKNIMIEQVLQLVHHLVQFGYYGDVDDIKQLVKPLMGLMDGRNDQKMIRATHKKTSRHRYDKEDDSLEARYRKGERYQINPETEAIVNAKYRAMEVLELLLTFQFNRRLETFVSLFTHSEGRKTSLGRLTQREITDVQEVSFFTKRKALSEVENVIEATAYLDLKDITPVLMDLSNYQYDKMVNKSMMLLNKLYTARADSFKYVIESQVLLTERSREVYRYVWQHMPQIRRLRRSKLTEQQAADVVKILDKFSSFCHLPGDPSERHPLNQAILINSGILPCLYGILTLEREDNTTETPSARLVIQHCFKLLQLLANGNSVAQEYVFTHLNNLLQLKGFGSEFGMVLIEVFTGNEETGMKVSPKQIGKITALAAEHKEKAPEFLDVLGAIVKVEELNLPIKKNQEYIIKYLMEYYMDIGYILDKSKQERLQVLLNERGPSHLRYMISLVELLATCAEGENQYIESVGQTLFTVDDLMEIITHPKVDANLKRPFLRYLLWVYVIIGGNPFDDPALVALPNTCAPWFRKLVAETKELTQHIGAHKEEVAQQLKSLPPKSTVSSLQENQIYGTLHFYFDALMPFLKRFFKKLYIYEQHVDLHETVSQLAEAFVELAVVLKPLLSNPMQMNILLQCVTALLTSSHQSEEVQGKFISRFNSVHYGKNVTSKAREVYIQEHLQEEKLNQRLNIFAVNLQKLYQGENSVHDQLGVSATRRYRDDDCDMELPLGQEFQQHLSCFIISSASSAEEIYSPALKLIQQLSISATKLKASDWIDPNQEELDVRCLQLLRALIHNQERRLPEDWKSDHINHDKELSHIQTIQDFMNNHDAMSSILPLISRPQENVVKEVLAFISLMLFNGCSSSQEALTKYFTNTRDELFFFVIRDHFAISALARKERKLLCAQYEAIQEEALAEEETLQTAAFTKHNVMRLSGDYEMIEMGTLNGDSTRATVGGDSLSYQLSPRSSVSQGLSATQVQLQVDQHGSPAVPEDPLADILPVNVEGHIELVLRVLAQMCDGQYKPLQDYLRYQPANMKTANLVGESTKFLRTFYTDIQYSSIDLVIQIFKSLVEFSSGNPENQVVIFENSIIDYINYILRYATFSDIDPEKVLELKAVVGELLMCLIEQSTKETKALIQDMVNLLDMESLRKIALEQYKEKEVKCSTDQEKRKALDVGFQYFFLLEKIADLNDIHVTEREAGLDSEMYKFYRKNSTSIEILMDGAVHRVRFTVRNRAALRDEVRNKVKWNIDRSSATGKLRDLVWWSKEIIEDAQHQQRVRSFPILAFFVQFWKLWNNGSIFLSLIINIIMLSTWTAPGSLGSTEVLENATSLPPQIHNPWPVTDAWYFYVIYILGGLHNILSLFMCISFFLSNRFRIPEIWEAVNLGRTLVGAGNTRPSEGGGTLKIDLIGMMSLYALCFFAFSLAGTFVYGYFFAFHLLNIIYSNQLLQRVMQAITQNGRSLLWVTVLGVIVIYIFALAAFAGYRGSFNPNGEQTLYCATLLQCTVTIMRYGVIGEMFEFMRPEEMERGFVNFTRNAVFHLAFFILITTIGLNIIFGIIVDTFSELRNVQWEAEVDMRKVCFICGRDSYEFESFGNGFQNHVKKEHNMWDYIYFFIYLKEKDQMDYTNLELYVHNQFEQDGYEFFPLNHALVLENLADDEMKTKMDEILTYVHALNKKQEAEQLTRQKEEERRKQQEWQEKHKASLEPPGSHYVLATLAK